MNLTDASKLGLSLPGFSKKAELKRFLSLLLMKTVHLLQTAGLDEPLIVMLVSHSDDNVQLTIANVDSDTIRTMLLDALRRYSPEAAGPEENKSTN